MIYMATTLGEAGETARASEILRFAAQSYPKDASVEFNLGLTLRDRPVEQMAAFGRAIELDPDMEAAYESLGAAQYAAARPQEAIQTFRKGLLINPLSAKLNYDLGLALSKQGDEEEGRRRMALAAKTDPETVSNKQ
jgi:tetratricopeptide (TPR) repeat protein